MRALLLAALTSCITDPERWDCQLVSPPDSTYITLYGPWDDVRSVIDEWLGACATLTNGQCLALCIQPPEAHEL